ncbi:hypothetical protein ACQKMD_14010 [Viridibacillus sp. NPDC096237]|uniref:hypothetical protein n=1 Tax=Viridibacillus sp. NPDC096237 TaxID=3390721 RepID=UPI003D06E195
MSNLALSGVVNWISILSAIFYVLCFYFTLTFFQQLKSNDDRLIKQTKIAAVVCLLVALLAPSLYGFYVYNEMMK